MENGFRARVVVRPTTPFDEDLILADFATFNIYYRREVWKALDDLLRDRSMTAKIANGIHKLNRTIAKVFGTDLMDPKDTIRAAQKMIENEETVLKYSVTHDDDRIIVDVEMPRWFLLMYQIASATSVPFVSQWYSEKAIKQAFRTLIEGYFNPKKQPYDVVKITFDPGGEPAKGTS